MGSDDAGLTWVRTPLQARSQATLTRLLDATEKLLDEQPFDTLTVQDICRAAKSSVGAFYTRFPDKIGLLHLLHERLCAEADATTEVAFDPARWEGFALSDLVTAMVAFMVGEYRERLGLRRELVRRNGIDAVFQARSIAVAARMVRALAFLLEARRSEITVTRTLLAADTCHRLLFAVLDQAACYPSGAVADVIVDDETMVSELSETILAYLTGPRPSVTDGA